MGQTHHECPGAAVGSEPKRPEPRRGSVGAVHPIIISTSTFDIINDITVTSISISAVHAHNLSSFLCTSIRSSPIVYSISLVFPLFGAFRPLLSTQRPPSFTIALIALAAALVLASVSTFSPLPSFLTARVSHPCTHSHHFAMNRQSLITSQSTKQPTSFHLAFLTPCFLLFRKQAWKEECANALISCI